MSGASEHFFGKRLGRIANDLQVAYESSLEQLIVLEGLLVAVRVAPDGRNSLQHVSQTLSPVSHLILEWPR